jgi:DNA helicase-2/ATP-dependent DNA helicase PcrA
MAYSTKAKKPWVKAPVVKVPRQVRPWSNLQIAIFEDFAYGQGNTQIDAYAGTSKTTTAIEGLFHLPTGTDAVACAFGSSTQKELEKRTPENVPALTFHALGYRASRKMFPRTLLEKNKGEKLYGFIKAERGDAPETNEVRDSIAQAVALCKGYLAHTSEEIDVVLDRHDIDTFHDKREDFISTVIKVMDGCKRQTNVMDFNDMIWFPNVFNMTLDKYDHVIVDECQDLNGAQINIAYNSVRPGGRIISVGDERQAIFAFAGADSNSINNIVSRLNSKRLPLSVTYRCCKSIVKLAQSIVPGYTAAPNAEEGLVEEIGESKLENMVKPGDFILSRTNAPLMKWCLTLLKSGVPANIKGRDMGKSLAYMIKKSKAKSVEGFLEWLEEFTQLEVARLVKAKRDPSVLHDKEECLRIICEGAKTLADVDDNLDKLFKEIPDENKVILSTIHKAKGLERDRCFVLANTLKIGKNIEEDNLAYVAWTRAKNALYLVR